MAEVSPLEADLARQNERHFVETLNTIAVHAEAVVMEVGERGDEHYSDMLFVLKEGSHTPQSLRDMQISLGLNSEVSAHITADGSGVLVNTPLSVGRLAEILRSNPDTDKRLVEEVEEAQKPSLERAEQVNLDSARQISASIRASLGTTYGGE